MAIAGINFFSGAGWYSQEFTITPTPGNLLIAVVTIHVIDQTTPTMCVGDSSANVWRLLSSTTTTAISTNGTMQVQVWATPVTSYAGFTNLLVYVSPINISTSDSGAIAVALTEFSGFANRWITVDSITATSASSTTSFNVAVPTPPVDSMLLAVVACDSTSGITFATTSGWSAIDSNGTGSPVYSSVYGQYRESTVGSTATFSTTAAGNWVGLAITIRQTGVATISQPNPNYPALDLQLGLGSNIQTPLSAVTWTSIPNRLYSNANQSSSINTQRGIQYELGLVQSSPTTLVLRNDDGAFTPNTPTSNIYVTAAATSNGTTTTINVSSATTGLNVADFFQLQTAGGALKELTVFQVTALATAGGTTTITFAKANGTVGGALTSTVTGDVYAATPIDVYVPYRVMATFNGVTYPVVTGWIERWPQTWTDQHWGYVNAIGIDVIATLTAEDNSALHGEIIRRNPIAYWPCNDSSGGTTAQNIIPGTIITTPLTSTVNSHGLGASSTISFGGTTQNIDTSFSTGSLRGDSGTAWVQNGLTSAEVFAHSAGGALVATQGGSGFSVATNSYTIMGVLGMTATDYTSLFGAVASGTTWATLFVARQAGTVRFKLAVGAAASTPLGYQFTWWDKTTGTVHATTTNAGTTGISPGFATWFILVSPTAFAVYTDSNDNLVQFSGSATGTNYSMQWNQIDVGGEADAAFNGSAFNGIHNHLAIFPRWLNLGEMKDISQARINGTYVNPGTNDVMTRKLAYAGWRGARVFNYTTIYCGTDVQASTIAEKVASLADQEGSKIFSDAMGQLQFRSQGHVVTYQVSKATLGDRPDLGEIPFVADDSDFIVDYDPTYIYNTVTVNNSGLLPCLINGTDLVASSSQFVNSSATSATRYGNRTLGKDVALQNNSDASALATSLLTRYQSPGLRIETILIQAAQNPSVCFPFVLDLEVGDILTVNRRPIGASMITFKVIVLQIQHDVGMDKWDTTITTGVSPI